MCCFSIPPPLPPKVFLSGTPGALFIKDLTRTLVCIGPVRRSLFVDSCVDCTFALACQQVAHSESDRGLS